MKESSFGVLKDDLGISFRFASRNIISFVLGMLGVLVVAFILMIVLAIIIFVPVVLGLISGFGMEGMIQFFTSFATTWSTPQGALMFGALMLLAMFILGPFFVAFGALFGMAREIVESEGTTAGGVFAWYRKKFFSLAGGGIILFLVVAGPVILSIIWVPGFVTGSLAGLTFALLMAALVLWVVVSAGMLSLLFPGIIDGLSALGAAKQSLRLSRRYFDRVFGTWLSFVGIISLTAILPLIGLLILCFLVIPAMAIALSRVYLILTDNVQETETVSPENPDFRLVGGV
jgi:amino acid transporter